MSAEKVIETFKLVNIWLKDFRKISFILVLEI